MIFCLKTFDLWESKIMGLHIEYVFLFCQKDFQGEHGSLKEGQGTKSFSPTYGKPTYS